MDNLRAKDVAKLLGVAVSTVWLYNRQGKIKGIKLSERVTVWARADLEAFVTSKV